MLIYTIKAKPMENPNLNLLEIINEVFTLCSFYIILFFTNWCYNVEVSYKVGELYMYFVISTVLVNILFVIKETG